MKRLLLLPILVAFATTATFAQDWAKARFEKSPRHYEWVKIQQGNRQVNAFITYPEVKNKATAVIVIHENQGLTDWVRGVTDQLAEEGYIAIAPDLLSGMAPNGGGTPELGSRDAVGKAFASLPADQVTADLNAVFDHVGKLPACNGKVAVMGFCWGGGQTFRYATNNKDIKVALVFYGNAPSTEEEIARINCPVYGFYGGNDARINAAIPKTQELMKAAAKTYEPIVYDSGRHGFMRAGEAPPPDKPAAKGEAEADQKAAADYERDKSSQAGNKLARDAAWPRVKQILGKI
ncbi:MAG TPA: dienelactone hydrolase family protein [Opitutaceae bacterium]|nr:dienelactone hydrolase family protein [Opitutaceae bacterium]